MQAGHLFDRASHFGVNSNLPLCFSGSEIRGIGALASQEDCLKNFVPDRGDVEWRIQAASGTLRAGSPELGSSGS